MKPRPATPAQQLCTVAGRYCHALAVQRPGVSAIWRTLTPQEPHSDAIAAEPAVDNRLARLEAVLLLAREPLGSRKLSQFANLADGTEARTLIRRLNENYDRAGRAFRVEEVAGGFQLLTRRKFAAWLRRLGHTPPEMRLSAPALETLAVIAYRGPVLRADIEAIRGVNCGEILRQLMERDLVRISGRSEELGRPFLYSTTKRFLQLYGLISLEDLPRAAALRASPLLPALASPPLPRDSEPLNFDQAADESADAAGSSDNPSGDEHELQYTTD